MHQNTLQDAIKNRKLKTSNKLW